MRLKPLFALLFITLAGCGSKPQKPVQAEAPKPQASRPRVESAETLPPESWRYKIVETAKEEWIYFGQQKVVIDGEEESIPHVGIWEDDNWSHSERVNQYWRAVGKPRLSGDDCRQPWSAAFVSWVMRTAGLPSSLFPPADAHRDYLVPLIAQAQGNPGAVWVPHPIREYSPKPGDLICANRGRGFYGEVAEELPQTLNPKLHCDIVVEIQGQSLQAIGGNVRNSVSKTLLTLTPEGYLQPSSHRPWFMVMENRLD